MRALFSPRLYLFCEAHRPVCERMNSFISCGMALPHSIDASDFAIRKVSFNPTKLRQNIRYELKVVGISSRTDDYCKSKMQNPFAEPT